MEFSIPFLLSLFLSLSYLYLQLIMHVHENNEEDQQQQVKDFIKCYKRATQAATAVAYGKEKGKLNKFWIE